MKYIFRVDGIRIKNRTIWIDNRLFLELVIIIDNVKFINSVDMHKIVELWMFLLYNI